MKRLAVLLITLATFATACQGNVFSLGVGDCFDDPDSFGEVSSVPVRDCSEPHDNEVYATFDVTASDFPGESAVQEMADEGCVDRFQAYVGVDFFSSSLLISTLVPTDQSWDTGDREILCFLFNQDFSKLNGSVKGLGI